MTIAGVSRRRLPVRGWIGLGVILVSEIGMLTATPPFYHWHTPIAWTGYLLFVDALVWRSRGNSWLSDAPFEFAFLATVSVPLWIVFELYNKYSLHNWYYVGLPEWLPLRYFGYVWSFATIWPGLFGTAALLEVAGLGDGARHPPRPPSAGLLRAAMLVGAVFLVVPPLLPAAVRPWTFGFVWLGFVLLLDPVNYHAGRPSFTGAWARGDRALLYRWLLAGLACGLLWEFWNYWAIARWQYVGVPVLPEWKIFEMPVVGYLGWKGYGEEFQRATDLESKLRDAETQSRNLQTENEDMRDMIGFGRNDDFEEVKKIYGEDMNAYGQAVADEDRRRYRTALESVFKEGRATADIIRPEDDPAAERHAGQEADRRGGRAARLPRCLKHRCR